MVEAEWALANWGIRLLVLCCGSSHKAPIAFLVPLFPPFPLPLSPTNTFTHSHSFIHYNNNHLPDYIIPPPNKNLKFDKTSGSSVVHTSYAYLTFSLCFPINFHFHLHLPFLSLPLFVILSPFIFLSPTLYRGVLFSKKRVYKHKPLLFLMHMILLPELENQPAVFIVQYYVSTLFFTHLVT